jgi:Ca-activated chloride channel family protein
MVVRLSAGLVALFALAVVSLPARAVADADAPVLIQTPGGVLCAVSANDVPRGGGPTVACQLANGQPFAQAPFSTTKPYPKMNLAVVRGGGQLQWEYGSVAGGQPINLAAGQSYHVNGWTIEAAEGRSTYAYGEAAHGFWIGPDFVHPN